MRVLSVVVLSLFVVAAFAGEADTDAEVDVESDLAVPTLPGLGSGCLPTFAKRNYRSRSWKRQGRRILAFGGKCVMDNECPEASSEPGYCAGMGVTCCKGVAVDAPKYLTRRERRAARRAAAAVVTPTTPAAGSPSVPILKAGTTPCASQGGSCIDIAACTAPGTTRSGLCPGLPNNVKCCFKAATPTPVTPTPTPTNIPLTSLVPIPRGINLGTTVARASALNAKLGQPGCPLSASCFSCTCRTSNALIARNTLTLQITPTVKVTGLKPFVEALKRGLDAMKADAASNPQLLAAYNGLKTAGGLCCRPIKRSNGTAGGSWSNHSWGAAVDFYFGADIDPRGDGKTQYGLSLIAPYLNREKLYWAAGFAGSEEDAMHFEASVEALNAWKLA